MPELPEVETIRRDLARDILNRTIEAIEIVDKRVLRLPEQEFIKRLKGKRITAIDRRGKALIFALSSKEYVVAQVMMTGQLVVDPKKNSHPRIIFKLSGGIKLLYNDQRVFGQWRVVKELEEIKYFRILGPEPFSKGFNGPYIKTALAKSKKPIKNMLMDHTFVAGIGNIYAAEILFRCGVSPQRPANRVIGREIKCIQEKTREVLKEAINSRGSSMRNYLDGKGEKGTFIKRMRVYAREDEPCRVCRTSIQRITQGGRSTFYCMKCQK